LQVDPTNVEQANAWDGDEGVYWAEHAEQFDRSVAAYHSRFLDACELRPADRVLDVGCGTGQTTRDAARRARDGHALGVDLSARMIEYARRRALDEGVANASFEQADAQVHPFAEASYDAVISRNGAMFFGDPDAAFANLARALRPSGRVALLTWQSPAANPWFRDLVSALAAGRDLPQPPPDAPGPFSLADPDRVHALLTKAGFAHVSVAGINQPMSWGVDVDAAYQQALGVLGWLLRDLDADGQARALDALRATLAAHNGPDGVQFDSAAWLVTARLG
jgi:SAM-dependent methyltransferase